MARDEWQLHGQLTAHIDQLLRDVDSEARAELRRSWPERERALSPALTRPVQTARERYRRRRRTEAARVPLGQAVARSVSPGGSGSECSTRSRWVGRVSAT